MLNQRRAVLGSLFAVAAAVTLSACGFHLRGLADTQIPFKTIYLAFPEASPLGIQLRRNLRGSGGNTELVATPKEAEAIVELLSETRDKTILSLNSQGRVREYLLAYTVRFRVKGNKDNELLAPTEVSLKRSLSYNETDVLAKDTEEVRLYRDMQTDLVQQLLRRIAAIKPAA